MANVRLLPVVLGVVAIALAPIAATAPRRDDGPLVAAEPAGPPVVVELFTSEGCSSCPPADILLSQFAASPPVAGALIIPLSEHVDYWDSLGWKDPFSDKQFTARQNAYAAAGDASDVYTPQMVVNGVARLVGSDKPAAVAAMSRAAATPIAQVGLRWTAAGELDATLQRASAGADVLFAITEDELASSVTAGENAGHRLTHTAVTRRLTRLGSVRTDGTFHIVQRPSVAAGWKAASLHFIVFAQLPKQGRVIAAGTIGTR